MDQNKCNICNKSFNSEQELQEHQRIAHAGGRKEQDRPTGAEKNQPDREKKIAS